MYKDEKEFLKNYNPKKFEQLSMTADILLVSVASEKQDNYRKSNEKKMSILLVKRDTYPYKDKWCLPGGFLNPVTETLEDTAKRILKSEVNLEDIYMEQLYTYDSIDRDPRCRVVSTAFIGLVDKTQLISDINPKASWFNIDFVQDDENGVIISLDNGKDKLLVQAKKNIDKSSTRVNYEIIQNDNIAFDHALVICTGIDRLRNKINYTDLVFYMMPKQFSLGDLQRVYEVILNKKLLAPAFRRIIADKVEKTDVIQKGNGHRPSVMFTYKRNI